MRKLLYGLKQASRDWFDLQENFILKYDSRFHKNAAEPCLYSIVEGAFEVHILVYVDDYVVAYSPAAKSWFKKFVQDFGGPFKVTNMGEPSNLLQMGITYSTDRQGQRTIALSQKKHIMKAVERFGLTDSKKRFGSPLENDP